MSQKIELLKKYFGHDSFREGQEELIDNILSGKDSLGIMPTGAGKSVCYQIPALMSKGVTIVVSPLISLMHDQVMSLVAMGIKSAYINSSLTSSQYETVIKRAYNKEFKIIYVAPERLETQSFIDMCKTLEISLIAVDEAHCVSQWGQDFRPSYLNICDFIKALPYRPTVAAFTATATKEVADDIISILGLEDPYRLVTGFDRENLYFGVIKPKNKFLALLKLLEENKGKSGIIYCATRKTVDELTVKLNESGITARRYHAGVGDSERRTNQEDFVFDRVPIIVATNAFGMGIDKSNVSFVFHYNMPKSPEAYYQEAGRAGRDGAPAQCIILYSPQDVIINNMLIEQSEKNSELDEETARLVREKDSERLKKMAVYCTMSECKREYLLSYFGQRSKKVCDNCSSCCANTETVEITIEAQKIISCVYRMRQNFGTTLVAEVLKGSKTERIKSLGFCDLTTYSIMSDTPLDEIKSMIDFLVNEGYLNRVGEYQLLKLTEKSNAVLKGSPVFYKRIRKTEAEKLIARKDKKYQMQYGVVDIRLLEQLKNLRTSLAKKENLPAYMIFSDSALRDMCKKLPTSKEEFSRVDGVGEKKCVKYCDYFVTLIRTFIANGHKPMPEAEGEADENVIDFLAKNKDKLKVRSATSLTYIIDGFLEDVSIHAKNREIFNAIAKWLVKEGYMSYGGNRDTRLEINENSQRIGIVTKKQISKNGTEYEQILYTEAAQKYIIENLGKIAQLSAKNNN